MATRPSAMRATATGSPRWAATASPSSQRVTGSLGVRVRGIAGGKGARRRRRECIVERVPVGAPPFRTVFRTKSIDAIVAAAASEGTTLKRVLGPLQLVALGVGAVIGTGIFATIGTASAGD